MGWAELRYNEPLARERRFLEGDQDLTRALQHFDTVTYPRVIVSA
jgi:hypothetical protein